MNTDIKNCGLRDTVIRVDLSAIAENMEHICQLVGKETAVAAVVKANGYGHGARAIAPTLIEHGAALLAVATLEEALELKQAFPDYPVLVMGLTPDRALPYAAEYGIIQTIDSLHQARLLNQAAADLRQPARIHLKVDTGFHRIGFSDSEAGIREMLQIKELPYLVTDGIFSHLALLDDASNLEQYQRFTQRHQCASGRRLFFPFPAHRGQHCPGRLPGIPYGHGAGRSTDLWSAWLPQGLCKSAPGAYL